VRQPVVIHYERVIDGDISSALFKSGAGIAAGIEERVDQVVGLSEGGLGMIDEAGLDGEPLGDKAIPFGGA
jgi:hypothetical protein